MPEPIPLSPAGLSRLDEFLRDSAGVEEAVSYLLPLLPQPASERRYGRFALRRVLGQGRFGIVFLADDPERPGPVALKLPQPGVLFDAEQMHRFRREAEAAGALDHPGVVPVLETGEVGSVPYLLTAFIDGPTLLTWLRAQPSPSPPRDAAALLAALAGAVHYAHGRGVLHCDLKPSNVLLEPVGAGDALSAYQPRVTDFGLARIVQHDPALTRTHLFAGSLPYMAPEQARGERRELTAACDVYALGVILYQVLTGRTPFHDADEAALLRRLLDAEPPPVRPARPGVPADLEAVVLRCLEKAPPLRYATAGELAEDLRRFLAGRPTLARPRGWVARLARRARRSPVAGAVAVCAGGLAVAGALSLPPPPPRGDFPPGADPAPASRPTKPDLKAELGGGAPAPAARPAKPDLKVEVGGEGSRWALDTDGRVLRWENDGWGVKGGGGARALFVDLWGRAHQLTTDRRVLRWMGDGWRNYARSVRGVAEDQAGRLHIVGFDGICSLQVEVGERVTDRGVTAVAGDPRWGVHSLTEDGDTRLWDADQERWVRTGGAKARMLAGGGKAGAVFRLDTGGISRWDGKGWRPEREGRHRSLLSDGGGAVWALQEDGGVSVWEGRGWRPAGRGVKTMVIDGAGAVFTLSANDGAVDLWDGAGWRATGSGGNEALLSDGEGQVWTFSRGGGVSRWVRGEWRLELKCASRAGVDDWGVMRVRAKGGTYFGRAGADWVGNPSVVAANGDVLVFDQGRSWVSVQAAGRWRNTPLLWSRWFEAGRDVLLVQDYRTVYRYVGAAGGYWQPTGMVTLPKQLVQAGAETFALEAGSGRVHRWDNGWVDTRFEARQLVAAGEAVLAVTPAAGEVFRYGGPNPDRWDRLGLAVVGRLVRWRDGHVYALSDGKLYRFLAGSFHQVPPDEAIRQEALRQ